MSMKNQTQISRVKDQMKDIGLRLLGNRKIVFGLSILIPLIIISVLAPILAPYDPNETHMLHRYAGLGGEFLLGTDHMGRDILSRVLFGGRTTLLLGFGAVALALLMGVPIGLVAGYNGGRIDEAIMRVMDSIMSIPTLLLGILLLTLLPPSVFNVILAVGVVYTPRIARVVRSGTLSVKREAFVKAAQSRGESDSYILFKEILPNVMPPIIVEGSVRIGFAILIGASLSFLGLGAQPPYPDWGFMVSTAREHIYQTPWFLLWPSLALAVTILSINVLGDGLRDVLDPKVTGEEV